MGDFAGLLGVVPLGLPAIAFTGLFGAGTVDLLNADFAGLLGVGLFSGLITAGFAGPFGFGCFLGLLTAGFSTLDVVLDIGAAIFVVRAIPLVFAVLRGLDDAAVLMTSFAMFVSCGQVSHLLLG